MDKYSNSRQVNLLMKTQFKQYHNPRHSRIASTEKAHLCNTAVTNIGRFNYTFGNETSNISTVNHNDE